MDAYICYTPKLLQAGELKEAFEQAVVALLGPEAQIRVRHPRDTGRAGVSDSVDLGPESLRAIVDLSKIDVGLSAELRDYSKRVHMSFRAVHSGTAFYGYAGGDVSVECLERVALVLGLERTEAPKDPFVLDVENIESRVLALEKAAKGVERTLRCFVSFKFDDARTVAQVDRLKRLLAAVHIEWVTGEQFEPRRIEDKVKARLRADLDFIIAVISKAGESKWIRDELADANSRGLSVVVLLEEGASFDKGIFGTLEYIPYDLAIEQTFPALLEGVDFIRAEISMRSKVSES
ncbi:MAG: hypothetical protein ABSG10_08235 [Terracidiphilus sp.]|jgi:hypothetical protein